MSKATKVTTEKYIDLITKSDEETSKELVQLEVDQASNTLEKGTLSLKSKLIDAEAEVKKAENAVSAVERKLNETKAQKPFSVQSILNARTAVLQSKLDVETKQEVYNDLKGYYDYLVALKEELF